MKRYRHLSVLLLAQLTALHAVAASARVAITAQQVAAVMDGAGMQISPKQVTMLSGVVASTAFPTLKIRSMEPWGDHRMMVRLDCANTEECLPFFVAVRFNQGNAIKPVPTDLPESSPAISRAALVSAPPAIRSGSPATLLLDGDHVHIRLSVISLENGSIGQTIRVASKDRRQVYMAEVVDGGLLKGKI